jgi:hypothetical protein
LAQKSRASFEKRQKERARQEKQREKQARRFAAAKDRKAGDTPPEEAPENAGDEASAPSESGKE